MFNSPSNNDIPLSARPAAQALSLPKVRTPCIGVCSTGIGDSVCRGCKRFAHEVIDWNAYSEEEKRIVDDRLGEFLSTCMQNKFVVMDRRLLAWQISVQQVRHNPRYDEYGLLHALLKAGASQIKDTQKYGFAVHLEWRDQTLKALLERVDIEFWELSVAHHQRYLATADLFGG